MHAIHLSQAGRGRLARDLRNVVSDIELFLSVSAGQAGESYERACAKLARALGDAKHRVAEGTRATTQATDAYVHDNAWKMVGLAAAAGLIAGLMVTRR